MEGTEEILALERRVSHRGGTICQDTRAVAHSPVVVIVRLVTAKLGDHGGLMDDRVKQFLVCLVGGIIWVQTFGLKQSLLSLIYITDCQVCLKQSLVGSLEVCIDPDRCLTVIDSFLVLLRG